LAPVTVEIACRNGENLGATRAVVYGNPGNPMRRADHLAKFRGNCAAARPAIPSGQAEALIARVDALADEADIAALVDLMIAVS
jgi:hypothetical protein